MDTDAHGSELTEAVIGAAFEVANVLGAGFLERVYERELLRELALRGVHAKAQAPFPVCYKGQYVGEYLADLVVEEKLIVELKCVERFANDHPAQCINYLKVSGLQVALLINFQKPKVEWKRVLLDRRHLYEPALADTPAKWRSWNYLRARLRPAFPNLSV